MRRSTRTQKLQPEIGDRVFVRHGLQWVGAEVRGFKQASVAETETIGQVTRKRSWRHDQLIVKLDQGDVLNVDNTYLCSWAWPRDVAVLP